jgi:4-azaleucine resistance transporter AzlC
MSSPLWKGFRATLPIALSVAPFGIAYGAVATQSLAMWQAGLMSMTVFAGTAQFVAASMLAQGAQYLPILITGILINMRLVLMSAALTPHVAKAPRTLYPVMAQLLTDETFAVSMAEFERRTTHPLFFVGSGIALYGSWQLATWIGILFGESIPAGLGLEYALSGSLICLLFLLVRGRRAALVALLAAVLSLALRQLITGTWSTMVATLAAATIGVLWRRPAR